MVKFVKFFFIVFLLVFGGCSLKVGGDGCRTLNGSYSGDDVVVMNFFYLDTCPHCHEQMEFHETLLEKYPYLRIEMHELSGSNAREIYLNFAERFDELDSIRIATPATVIGDEVLVGFDSPEGIGKVIEDMIEEEHEKRILECESNE